MIRFRIKWKHGKKIWAPDEIRTYDPPCSRSDALTIELLRTRYRAKVKRITQSHIQIGTLETCMTHTRLHHAVTLRHIRDATIQPQSEVFCTTTWCVFASNGNSEKTERHMEFEHTGRACESHLGLGFFPEFPYLPYPLALSPFLAERTPLICNHY